MRLEVKLITITLDFSRITVTPRFSSSRNCGKIVRRKNVLEKYGKKEKIIDKFAKLDNSKK